VLLADDHALLRRGFQLIVNADPAMTVVGEASDGEQALAETRRLTPDIVLMDVRMPGADGIAATQQITNDPRLASKRVLVLTTFDLDEYVYSALRAGASGFILKDITPEDLLAAIRVIASGEALLAPSITRRLITRRLIGEFARRPEPRPHVRASQLEDLTDREVEVLSQVAKGLSNSEIAAALHMSPGTAKTHVGRLLNKLDARERTQLVVIAYEAGVAVPNQHTHTQPPTPINSPTPP